MENQVGKCFQLLNATQRLSKMKTEKDCYGVNGFEEQMGKRGQEVEVVLLKTQESEEVQVMGQKGGFWRYQQVCEQSIREVDINDAGEKGENKLKIQEDR